MNVLLFFCLIDLSIVGLDIWFYLAAVLLKQFVKQHWQEDDEAFVPPVVSPDEKAVLRQLLPSSLNDPHGKIRTAIGMAVASIAQCDWPDEWPDLLPYLLKLISDQSSMDGVRGALRCLALISGDLDDALVPTLVPVLFPCLYTIVSSSHLYEKSLRAKAISIVHSCSSVLGTMCGVYKTETIALMKPMLKPWIEQFSHILQPPVQSEDPDDWSIRMEVSKCLIQFIQNFPSITEAEFSVIMAPMWQTFVSCLEVYEQSSIKGINDSYSGRYDSDGVENSLESFVIQLFELLLTIMANRKLMKVIGGNVQELVYYTIPFLQMTEEQEHTWSLDANQYVADEDDVTYSCRVSGALLLEEVVNAYGEEEFDSIIEAVQKRFSQSSQEKYAGSTDWWRLQEASVFALSSVSESLLEAQASGIIRFNLGDLLGQMLSANIGSGINEYPFLHARAFSAAAKFSSVISQIVREQFLHAAMKAIASDVPAPVKVGACRAVAQLLQESNMRVVEPYTIDLLSALIDLLRQASDETLHLVLETIQAVVKSGHQQMSSIEPIISPIILNTWVEHVSDPFISIDAIEVLEAIKNVPGYTGPLVFRVLPSVKAMMESPNSHPTGLVAGSLDLLTMLLKDTPIDIIKAVFDACFHPVIRLILESTDHSEMQNATECLATFVSRGKQELLAWGGDPHVTMKSLLDAASRLLDPDLDSSGSLFVGSYVLQLILHLPSQMAHHIRDLIGALVRRMQSCEIAGLKSSLLLIFARLVHLSAPNVEQFIELLLTVPAAGYENALVYVMSEWSQHQGEINGSYQIKVTTSALALLLSTRHPQLAKINVKGHLIKSHAGITTRSKAKLFPDQWTIIPLPAKMLALLADVLVEMEEQGVGSDDEDSDWEEIHDGDDSIHQDILASVTSNARASMKHLDAMAKAFDESIDDDDGDDSLVKGVDPLNEINVANYLMDFLAKFSNTDRPLFDHLCQCLTVAQRNAVERVLNK
ncbi:hypothetical protein QJS10_CPA08g01705 [Acorus calamus]|uniref:Importin N-terminal domain-containing protein n=1 Tax=Acorus calamus TaxID=4465 RepID=A0AAV9EE08_ACOCL|nr:hypothetical protein QJS10_CPA08g01705 [Acorus calamus]